MTLQNSRPAVTRASRRAAASTKALAASLLFFSAAAAAQPKVYLYVDKPSLFGAGHAWVGMDPGDGSVWQGGLYPGTSGAKGARNSPGVIRDDSTRGFTHRVCYNVTPAQYNAIRAAIIAKQQNGTTYQLCPAQTPGPGTNCAGWATQKLRTGGVAAPNPTNNAGYPDPYALGQILDNLGCGRKFGDGVVLCDHEVTPHVAPVPHERSSSSRARAYISGGYFGFLIMAHGAPQELADQLIMPASINSAGAIDVGPGQPFTISFSNVDPEALVSVKWGDSDSFEEGELTYSHAYAAPGAYIATAIVIDDGAVRNWSIQVSVVDNAGAASLDIAAPDFTDAPVVDLPAPPFNPPPALPGPLLDRHDFNFDGAVDAGDLSLLLGDWGSEGGPCDLNNDWMVDASDLSLFLSAWGQSQ